ncbi:hypothetical protein [uncultured Demequina sp.]|uniref:hypothetical protein n=1 Tax=uncultured Demequina sp. TaxID=693499 RepID=UPI0025E769D1|nr:hypothetical protein [uncultured Demequina sp.]
MVVFAGVAACAAPPEAFVEPLQATPGLSASPSPGDTVSELGAPAIDVSPPAVPIVTVSRSPEPEPEPAPAQAQRPDTSGSQGEPAPTRNAAPTATERACDSINTERSTYGYAVVPCSYSSALADLLGEILALDNDMGVVSWHIMHIPTIADVGTELRVLDDVGPAIAMMGPGGQYVTGADYSVLHLACKHAPSNIPTGEVLWHCAFLMV